MFSVVYVVVYNYSSLKNSKFNSIRRKIMEQTKAQEKPQYPRRERSQIMTPKEAAKYLGFHLVTIYRLLKKGEVPATKIGGQWRFKKDVLDSWLMDRMNQ